MGFTNHFTGLPIEPASVSSQFFLLEDHISLTWPTSFVDPQTELPNVVAGRNYVTSSDPWNIAMPDATQVSIGTQVIFTNLGEAPFDVVVNDKSTSIVTIAVGESWVIAVIDNTTVNGGWNVIQFGAGTSSAQASQLVGLGLSNQNNRLNTNIPNQQINSNFQAAATDLAKLFINTSGAILFTLPAAGASIGNYTVSNGWFISINNGGTGDATVVTADGATIDGANFQVLAPQQSSYFVKTLAGWSTVGMGVPTFFTDQATQVLLDGASGNIVLEPAQQNNNIIQFTGTPIGAVTVVFNASVGSWFLYNNTNNPGEFTISVQLAGGSTITPLLQGKQSIVYSDGVELYLTPTTVTSNATFEDGNAINPSIGFASDSDSGFYKVAAGQMGYSSAGNNTIQLGEQLFVASGEETAPSYSFLEDSTTGVYYDTATPNALFFATNGSYAGSFGNDQTLDLAVALLVSSGGTGRLSFPRSNIIASNSTSLSGGLQTIPNGAAGTLLQSTGTSQSALPAFSTAIYPTGNINANTILGATVLNNVVPLTTLPFVVQPNVGGTGVNNTGTINIGSNNIAAQSAITIGTGAAFSIGNNAGITTNGTGSLTLTTTTNTTLTLPSGGTLVATTASASPFLPSASVTGGSITVASQSGVYSQSGKLVNFTLKFSLNNISSPTGDLQISCSGLPTYNTSQEGTPLPINAYMYFKNSNTTGLAGTGIFAAFFISGGGSPVIQINYAQIGVATPLGMTSSLTSTSAFFLSGSYIAA